MLNLLGCWLNAGFIGLELCILAGLRSGMGTPAAWYSDDTRGEDFGRRGNALWVYNINILDLW